MGVSSLKVVEYFLSCDGDECDYVNHVVNIHENIYTKQQAIKWANMHKLRDGRVLCQMCFDKYKKGDIK